MAYTRCAGIAVDVAQSAAAIPHLHLSGCWLTGLGICSLQRRLFRTADAENKGKQDCRVCGRLHSLIVGIDSRCEQALAKIGFLDSMGESAELEMLVSVELNHTLVSCCDQQASAAFMASILGLPKPFRFGRFLCVDTENGVSMDFMEVDGGIHPQHYAFLISETEFDEIFARIEARGLDYWADPMRSKPGKINQNDGGRGVYFCDPDGHFLEILTRPYGSADV